MIPKASQRGGASDLATHLMNAYDNEQVIIHEVRGAIASDLHGAFAEWEVLAETLTKCKKHLYSLSLNPDQEQGGLTPEQYDDYISRVEKTLGLEGQPRAIVFHEKYGRQHCHVVWSRVLAEQEKAVQISFDHSKLMMLTKAFARDYGIELPEGYYSKERGEQKRYQEIKQEHASGISKDEHKARVTECWQHSDSPLAFVQALAERGYMLARGNRDYLVVDFYGGHYSLARLIDKKEVRIKQVRERLSADFPNESLPELEEAKALVAAHRKEVENFIKDAEYDDRVSELKRAQKSRRQSLEIDIETLAHKQHALKLALSAKHKAEHDALKSAYLEHARQIRLARYRSKPKGLADFLGRISGVNLIRRKLQQREDQKRLAAYRAQVKQIKDRQAEEQRRLSAQLALEGATVQRQIKSLMKVETRERASLDTEFKREQRTLNRGRYDEMPPLVKVVKVKQEERENQDGEIDLLAAFENAKRKERDILPDILSAFEKASGHDDEEEGRSDTQGDKEAAMRRKQRDIEQGRKPKKRDDDFDRGL